VLDAAIDPANLQASADEASYRARAASILELSQSTEDFLDNIRDMAQEEMFLIGVRTLSGILDPLQAGQAYTALAGAILDVCLRHVEETFAQEYGRVQGGRCVVLGMGKFGSREMTASSDLDIVLLYDFDEANPESDGARKLHAVQYYTRLTQRLVSALTVATRRGRPYEVDMRLRPSGGKGPVATQFRGFLSYQREEAETWEHMALTRARVVAGEASMTADVSASITSVLQNVRDKSALAKSVREMRALIAQEKGDSDPWDLKLASGGIIDVEFIAQYLVLLHSKTYPQILETDCALVLQKSGEVGILDPADADLLVGAHRLYSTVTQMMRLTIEGSFDPKTIAKGVLRRIAAAADCPDFVRLERQLTETRQNVRTLFNRLLG